MSDTETKNEIPPTAPAWMASQTPKTDTTPPASGETKKARKPRRTKAQMLADAAARPDAEKVKPDATPVPPGKEMDPNWSTGEEMRRHAATSAIAISMAAEDHRDAVVRDVDRIVPRTMPRINRSLYERHGHHVPLAVAIVALILAIVK